MLIFDYEVLRSDGDGSGGAPAPAEPETPAAPPQGEPSSSPRAALERAFKDFTDETQPSPERKTENAPGEDKGDDKASEAAGERKRDEHGRFVKSDANDAAGGESEKKSEAASEEKEKKTEPEKKTGEDEFTEPPARLSAEAKVAWKNAPLAVRADIVRTIRENEAGIEKYRSDATAYEPLKPYADIAAKHNTSIKATLDSYLQISRGLNDPDPNVRMRTIEHVVGVAGMNLRDLAAAVSGQKPDQVTSQQDTTIRELRAEIGRLNQRLDAETTNIKTTFQEQRARESEAAVQQFISATDASGALLHPRFEELGDAIAKEINSGYDLPTAYKRAELLNPVPQAPKPEPQAGSDPAKTPAAAQTDKGSLQVSGAPGSGSDPNTKAVPATAREALERHAHLLG